MKKLYLFLPLIIYIAQSFCIFFPAQAESWHEYKRVINDTTPFYSNALDESPLFYLPYTYYVKVLSEVGEYAHVEIHGEDGQIAIDGFVPSQALFFDGQQVLYPYLDLKVSTLNTTLLYLDPDLTEPSQYVFADRELTYYGEFSSAQGKVFYVSYNNRLGYVKETDIYPFTIQNHPNELTFLPKNEPENTTDKTSQHDFFSIKFIIIACLIFAGLFALFVALNNKSKKQTTFNYYEENDYE